MFASVTVSYSRSILTNRALVLEMLLLKVSLKDYYVCYTLSHPENDHDVTECAQGYTRQDASFMRQSGVPS